jgi:trypsin
MRRVLLCLLAAAAASLFAASPAHAVIGGTPVGLADVPFVVQVHGSVATGGGGLEEVNECDGVVVADPFIVTAAHCVAGFDAARVNTTYGAVVGSYVWVHPQWDGDVDHGHDLAVVELHQGDLGRMRVSPVPAGSPPWESGLAAPNTIVTIVGDGLTDPADVHSYGTLNAADVVVRADPAGELLVGAGAAGHTSCLGDSGGPMLARRNGARVLVGVSSYTHTAACDTPAVYGRISGPNLAWLATMVPAVKASWPTCLDAYGNPGIPLAKYEYQPWAPNDGTYFAAVTCGIVVAQPPPTGTVHEFTASATGSTRAAAMKAARDAALRKAANAGFTHCDLGDNFAEPAEDGPGYDGTATVLC